MAKRKKIVRKSKTSNLERRVEELELQVGRLRAVSIGADERFDRLEQQIEEIVEGLGGGIWRSQAGYARFYGLLSTPHLKNILAWPRASDKARELVSKELARREIDQDMRRKEFEANVAAKAQAGRTVQTWNADPSVSVSRKIALARAQEIVKLLGG